MKVITTGPKKKSPKKPSSSSNRSIDNYKNFLGDNREKTNKANRDKKVIQVKRKKGSPRISKSNDIRNINDIEMKIIQMKNNKIQVPTQNVTSRPKKDIVVAKPHPVDRIPSLRPLSLKSPSKRVTKVRISDIDVSEKRSEETESKTKTQPKTQPKSETKTQPKTQPKSETKTQPKSETKTQPKSETKTQPKTQPKSLRKTHRSNTRSNHRSIKKKSRPRNITVKTEIFNGKNIKEVESRMKDIRNKKTDEIKTELEKQGVKVSGKSNRLIRDIYLYSKICNINIQHEK